MRRWVGQTSRDRAWSFKFCECRHSGEFVPVQVVELSLVRPPQRISLGILASLGISRLGGPTATTATIPRCTAQRDHLRMLCQKRWGVRPRYAEFEALLESPSFLAPALRRAAAALQLASSLLLRVKAAFAAGDYVSVSLLRRRGSVTK